MLPVLMETEVFGKFARNCEPTVSDAFLLIRLKTADLLPGGFLSEK